MATYTIKINERTKKGKKIVSYLEKKADYELSDEVKKRIKNHDPKKCVKIKNAKNYLKTHIWN